MSTRQVFRVISGILFGVLVLRVAVIGYYDSDLPVIAVLAVGAIVAGVIAGRLKDREGFGR